MRVRFGVTRRAREQNASHIALTPTRGRGVEIRVSNTLGAPVDRGRQPDRYTIPFVLTMISSVGKDWDVFISYASEDKESVAKPLATHLNNMGLRVWFDETALQVGDSLSEAIGAGLANSEFGIVVISREFLRKKWPRNELATLFSLESAQRGAILPVWHHVTAQEVATMNPLLADRVALNSSVGIDELAQRIYIKILQVSSDNDRVITRHWIGVSGRLQLRQQQYGNVLGQYDWYGEEWAGRINGEITGDVIIFDWKWSLGDRAGKGFFIHHSRPEVRGRRSVPHLYGAWWFAATDVDRSALISKWYTIIDDTGGDPLRITEVTSDGVLPWHFAAASISRWRGA